jgi:hypothetical protein
MTHTLYPLATTILFGTSAMVAGYVIAWAGWRAFEWWAATKTTNITGEF